MNTKFPIFWGVLVSLSLAGMVNSVAPAQANTAEADDSTVVTAETQEIQTPASSEAPTTTTTTVDTSSVEQSSTAVATEQEKDKALPSHSIDPTRLSSLEALVESPDLQRTEAIAVKTVLEPMPAPGSTATSAELLLPDETVAQTIDPADTTAPPPLTDTEVSPGRATRTSYSFIGFGANIGISGSKNALTNDVSFALFSKIGMTPDLSVRPTLLIRNDVYITLPITFDFSPFVTEDGFRLGPYFGGGLAISTGNTSYVRPLLTAGLDVPLGPQFTGTAGFNFAFFDSVDVGFIVGIGYNFRGF